MLSIIDKARLELWDVVRYYNEERDGLGDEFLAAAERAFKQIEENPALFPRLETIKTRRTVRRVVLHRFSYLIVYEETFEGDAKILAVSHDRRRPNYWKKRLKES